MNTSLRFAIGDRQTVDAVRTLYPAAVCNKHTDEHLKIYCLQCDVVICLMCYIELHNLHKWSDVSKVAEGFRQQLADDVCRVTEGIEHYRAILKTVLKDKQTFEERVDSARSELRERAQELKALIDSHEQQLAEKLDVICRGRLEKVKTFEDEINRQIYQMESLTKNTDEVIKNGTACEIARENGIQHQRANELLKEVSVDRVVNDLGSVYVSFKQSNFPIRRASNMVGQVHTIVTRIPKNCFSVNDQNTGNVKHLTHATAPMASCTKPNSHDEEHKQRGGEDDKEVEEEVEVKDRRTRKRRSKKRKKKNKVLKRKFSKTARKRRLMKMMRTKEKLNNRF